MAIEYAYGVVFSYLLSGMIWLYMFGVHVKMRNEYSFGGLFISVGMFVTAWRCYLFYLVQGNITSPDIMFSVYISSACFSSGSIMISLPLFLNKA